MWDPGSQGAFAASVTTTGSTVASSSKSLVISPALFCSCRCRKKGKRERQGREKGRKVKGREGRKKWQEEKQGRKHEEERGVKGQKGRKDGRKGKVRKARKPRNSGGSYSGGSCCVGCGNNCSTITVDSVRVVNVYLC